MVAIALVTISGLSMHIKLLNLAWTSALWEMRSSIIRLVLMAYGVLVGLLALVSAVLIRYRNVTLIAQCVELKRSVISEVRGLVRWVFSNVESYRAVLWMALITAVGLIIRAFFMSQPMRYDEAYTFLNFVNKGFLDLFSYPLPNNHVFHTLLVRGSTGLLGSHPITIRLPALLAGVCTIPASFCLSKLLGGKTSGFLAPVLVAVFPYLVLYDTMARGYSLMVLLSLLLAILILRFASAPSFALCFFISLISALGILTIPTFVFPLVGLYVWIAAVHLIRGRSFGHVLTNFVVPSGGMTGILSGIFYTPTIVVNNGVHTLLHNRFVASLSWSEFLARLPQHISHTFADMLRDVPISLVVVLLLFISLGALRAVGKKMWEILLLVPALVGGALVILFLKHAIPYCRTWIYVLPFIFIMADIGFAGLITEVRSSVRFCLHSGIVALACFWGFVLMSRNVIATYPDTGHFPEAPAVVELLSTVMKHDDQVVVSTPADVPVFFYMWYESIPKGNEFPEAGQRKTFFIVKKSQYSLEDLTNKRAKKLMDFGDAQVYMDTTSGY